MGKAERESIILVGTLHCGTPSPKVLMDTFPPMSSTCVVDLTVHSYRRFPLQTPIQQRRSFLKTSSPAPASATQAARVSKAWRSSAASMCRLAGRPKRRFSCFTIFLSSMYFTASRQYRCSPS